MRSSSLAIPALSLLLYACGGGSDSPAAPSNNPPSNPPGGNPSTSATVRMSTSSDTYGYESNSFDPGSVTIKVGGNVTWTYNSSVEHNVTFDPATGAPANVPGSRSGSASRTFSTVGDFDYQCTNHPGMSGSVRVVP